MTYSTSGKTDQSLLAFHEQDGAVVVLRVGPSSIILDRAQREALAEYLLRENN